MTEDGPRDEFPEIVVNDGDAAGGGRLRRRRTSSKATKQAWIVAGGLTGVVVILLLGVMLGVALFRGGPRDGHSQRDGESRHTKRTSPSRDPEMSEDSDWPVFVLDWPEDQRAEAAVFIDGVQKPVPASGPVEYKVPPSLHRVLLVRRGFEPLELFRAFKRGEPFRYTPEWTGGTAAGVGLAGPSFDDWLQDLDAAKKKASSEGKDVLIVFDASDWCGWSIRLAHEVFHQPEFRERAEKQFVLVFVDFPRGPEAKSKVQDPGRNAGLAQRFGVQGYPTIVLADDKGLPYGVGGYVEGGADAFLDRMVGLQDTRRQRDELFRRIETSEQSAKSAAVQEAITLLRDEDLIHFYGPILARWLHLARELDVQNDEGFHEVVFEAKWQLDVGEAETTERLRELVGELDEWKETCQFQDDDLAVRLHLIAVGLLIMLEEEDEARRFAEAGMQYQPSDASLAGRLKQAAAAVSRFAPSGTGFVVGADGYVVTNYHVVEDEGDTLIQLPGAEAPIPVRTTAQDPGLDLALLHIQPAEGAGLKPVRLSVGPIPRGAAVGTLGFPLGEMVGSGIKLTTGVVSATAEQTTNGMILLDCRVNPGNSGGPLCDRYGNVVGLVTAKSLSGFGIDSYGMALPASAVRDFLEKHLPGHKAQESGAEELPWDEIDRRIAPSVVMVLKSR